jgi:hypothetical protein
VAGDAHAASPAAPSSEHCDRVAFSYRANAGTCRRHDAGVFVTQYQRHSHQDGDLTVDDVDVAVAKSGATNGNEHLSRPRTRRRKSSI